MYKVGGNITDTDLHIVTNNIRSIEKIAILYIDNIWIKYLNCWYSISNQLIALPFTGIV